MRTRQAEPRKDADAADVAGGAEEGEAARTGEKKAWPRERALALKQDAKANAQ